MNLLERAIQAVCTVLLWASTTVIFGILVVNTILRYLTGSSLQWANEVPELLFPWLVMAGVVLAALKGAHITTSFLLEKLPAKVKPLVLSIGWLAVGVLYLVLSKATFQMLEIVHDEKSPILHIPGSVTYACVLLGMVMLAILALLSAWRVWKSGPQLPNASDEAAPPSVHW